MSKKTHPPVLIAGVSIMITVFVITCVIGLTILIIKRDLVPTYTSASLKVPFFTATH